MRAMGMPVARLEARSRSYAARCQTSKGISIFEAKAEISRANPRGDASKNKRLAVC